MAWRAEPRVPIQMYFWVDMSQTVIFVTNPELLPFCLWQTTQRGLSRQSEGHMLCRKSLISHSFWEHVCLSENEWKWNMQANWKLSLIKPQLELVAHWEKLKYWLFHFQSEFFEINFLVRHMQSSYWTNISILTGLCGEFSKQCCSPDVCHITGNRWKINENPPKKGILKKGWNISSHHVKLLDIHESLLL